MGVIRPHLWLDSYLYISAVLVVFYATTLRVLVSASTNLASKVAKLNTGISIYIDDLKL